MAVHDDIRRKVLEGSLVEPTEIDKLLRERASEADRVEYKAGGWLDGDQSEKKDGSPGKPFEPAAMLRKWTAGFANSVGGLLVVGVDAEARPGQPWRVTGLEAAARNVHQDLEAWPGRALSRLGGHLDPPPGQQIVGHDDGKVMLVAVSRARSLVPCVEKSQLVYYLRFGESTLRAPDYLLQDLFFGRHQQPKLTPTSVRVSVSTHRTLDINGLLENRSVVWATDHQVGLLLPDLGGGLRSPPEELSGWARVGTPPARKLVHGFALAGSQKGVGPMASVSWRAKIPFAPPRAESGTLRFAIYGASGRVLRRHDLDADRVSVAAAPDIARDDPRLEPPERAPAARRLLRALCPTVDFGIVVERGADGAIAWSGNLCLVVEGTAVRIDVGEAVA